MNTKYKLICEQYPLLSRAVRNSLMSKVTNSEHRIQDNKEVILALKKFKKKKRLKVIEMFMNIQSETKDFVDIIPNIVIFFESIDKLKK